MPSNELIAVCLPSPSSAAFTKPDTMSKAVQLASRAEAAIVAALGRDVPPKLPKGQESLAADNEALRLTRFSFCCAIVAEGLRRLRADVTDEQLEQIARVAVDGLEAAGLSYSLPEVEQVREPAPKVELPETDAEREARARNLAELLQQAEALAKNPPRSHEVVDTSARILGALQEQAEAVKSASQE